MTKSLRHTMIFVGVLTALRLGSLAFQSLDLGPDEAQYWDWAQHPAFGYFSKPPMIAWLIGFTTRIAGDGTFGVRLAAPLLHAATALLIYATTQKLYDQRCAMWSAIVYVTLPAVSFSSGLITTDIPLLFFWAGALYVLVEALDRPSLPRAILLGALIGLGLLSKYAMAYFILSALVAGFVVPGMRRLMLSGFGLVTLLAAGVVFAPNIVWNMQHGFATVAHTASNAHFTQELVHPSSLGGFLLTQLGVFGPILFVMLIVITVSLIRDRTQSGEPDRLLACFSLPVILAACLVAFLSRANANWAAPAYVAATPLVTKTLIDQRRRLLFAASLTLQAVAAILLVVGMAYPAFADMAGLSNALKRVRGWTELGGRLSARAGEAPFTAILADDRELMGELIYYIQPRRIPVVMWDWDRAPRNHYEIANRIDAATGAHVLFVSLVPAPVHVLQRFQHTEPLGPLTVQIDPARSRTLYLFDLEGFETKAAVP